MKKVLAGIFLTALLAATLPALAQITYGDEPPPRTVPPTPEKQKPEEEKPAATLKVQVRLVNLFFNVRDHHNGLIGGLKKEDFEVSEDGVKQTIKFFNRQADQPLTLGILLDTSGSQQRVLPMTRDIAAAFLRDVLRPKDIAFLISFDVNVDLLQDYTSSPSKLRAALDKARINQGGGFGGGGIPGLGQGPIPQHGVPRGTLLYDAIWLAAREKLRSETGRKAMIILTDGMDEGSRTKLGEAIEAAQKADAIVYVILEWDRYYGAGSAEMDRLSRETGGRLINEGTNEQKLRDAFEQISDELRTQYNLGYTPSNPKLDGKFRKVEIKTVGQELKVLSRKGYYAPTESDE